MKSKRLTIKWQRLIDAGETCPRCAGTGQEIEQAVKVLQERLCKDAIEIILEKTELSLIDFEKNPLQSNRIWINDRPLEEYLEAQSGQSQCCDICGDADCRTLELDDHTYETIPDSLIIQAGLKAAEFL